MTESGRSAPTSGAGPAGPAAPLVLPLVLPAGPASCFPLLPPGTHAGVNGGPDLDAGGAAAYAGIVASGGDLAQIGVTWADVEPAKGRFDFTGLLGSLEWAKDQGQHAVVGVNVINTNVLSIPSDLLNPLDKSKLRRGLTWASPELIQRFALVLEQAARIAYLGGAVHFSVGNEVDAVLAGNTAMQYPFAEFCVYAKTIIANITSPSLSVGVSYTWDGFQAARSAKAAWLDIMLNVTDGVLLTWYPLQSNFSVLPPQVGGGYWASALAAVPADKCVIQQELGYPSGYGNASSVDGSSSATQASFFSAVLGAAAALPPAEAARLRGVLPFDLQDWSQATCEHFAEYCE